MKLRPIKLLILGFVFATFGFSSNQAKSPAKTENFSFETQQKNKISRQNISKTYHCFVISTSEGNIIKNGDQLEISSETFDAQDDNYYFCFQDEFDGLGYERIDEEDEHDVYIYNPGSDLYLSYQPSDSQSSEVSYLTSFVNKETATKFHIGGRATEITFELENTIYRLMVTTHSVYNSYYTKRQSSNANITYLFSGEHGGYIAKEFTVFEKIQNISELHENDRIAILVSDNINYYSIGDQNSTNREAISMKSMFNGNSASHTSFYYEQIDSRVRAFNLQASDSHYLLYDGTGYLSGNNGSPGLIISNTQTDYCVWDIQEDSMSQGYFNFSISKGAYINLNYTSANRFSLTKGTSGVRMMIYRERGKQQINCEICNAVTRTYQKQVENLADLSEIAIEDYPITVFNQNEAFSHDGLTLRLIYADNSYEIISEGFIISEPDMSISGNQYVEISYGNLNTGYYISINEAVFPPSLTPTLVGIELVTPPSNQYYWPGDNFSYEGLTIRLLYSDESQNAVISQGFNVSLPNMNQTGQQIITVSYADKTTSFGILIKTPHPIEFDVGESYDLRTSDEEFNSLSLNDIEFSIANPSLISRNSWVLTGILSGNTILTLTYLPTGAREQFALTIHDPSSEQGEDPSGQEGENENQNPDVDGEIHQDNENGTPNNNDGQGGVGEGEGNNPGTGTHNPQLNKEDNMVVGIAAGGTAAAIVIGAVSAITTVSIKKKRKAKAAAQDKKEE